jgi:hypothetical protein
MQAATEEQRQLAEEEDKHIPINEWLGCCAGVADYLVRQRDFDGQDRVAVASALQRLSGWYHTGIPLWYAFQPAAEMVGNILCGKSVLHYLKIGEEWSFDITRLNAAYMNEGYIFLWHFAEGVTNSIRTEEKHPDETRTLASRLLNFICDQGFRVRIEQEEYDFILSQFPADDPWVLPRQPRLRERHPLLRWSVENDFVGMLAQRIIVPAQELLVFLRTRRFNPDKTYKPSAEMRLNWFRGWRRL